MGIFSSSSAPAYVPPQIPEPPPPPQPVSDEALKAAASTKSKAAAMAGFGSTLITGGQGDTSAASVTNPKLTGNKTALGA